MKQKSILFQAVCICVKISSSFKKEKNDMGMQSLQQRIEVATSL